MTGTLPCHAALEEALAAVLARPAAWSSAPAAWPTWASSVRSWGVAISSSPIGWFTHPHRRRFRSRARLVRFLHNDVDQLDGLMSRTASARRPGMRFLVVTESVFSMDGDRAPLRDLCEVARRHEAMILVDEAHALGVLGPDGGGLVREHSLVDQVNACTATLSKALGSYGGFVACSRDVQSLLVNRRDPSFTVRGFHLPVSGAARRRSMSSGPNRTWARRCWRERPRFATPPGSRPERDAF